MSINSLTLLLASLSFTLALAAFWWIINNRRHYKKDKYRFSAKLDRLSQSSEQQYFFIKENIHDYSLLFGQVVSRISPHFGEDLNNYFKKYKEETIVRLRKIEAASSSTQLQLEALLFFVGSEYGKREDVYSYIFHLYNRGVFENGNMRLAKKILNDFAK